MNQTTSNKKPVDMNKVFYYSNLLFEKIDLQEEAFVERIEAMIAGDMEKVEFIEKMFIEPIEMQISYLIDKKVELLTGKKE